MAIFSHRHCNRSTHHHSKQENRTQAKESLKHTDMLCLETPEILSINVKTLIYRKCWFSAFWGRAKKISYLPLALCTDNQIYNKEGKMFLKQIHMSKQVTSRGGPQVSATSEK